MTTQIACNERIKHRYFTYLKEAHGNCEQTLDGIADALARFEVYTKHRDFKKFHSRSAIAFKKHLAEQNGERSGEKLSMATMNTTLRHLRRFFLWLAGQNGFKSHIQYADSEYFNLTDKDMRVATARREQKSPTLDQVKHVISTMPAITEIERRNRALIAFTILTGARDSAIVSMKLKHVDLSANCIYQDAREVKTKFSKTFTTYFFPLDEDIRQIVADWVMYLREEKLWGNDDPLFPSTRVAVGASHQFEVAGLDRKHWSNATPMRTIFREAFASAGLPYFNPHSFRNTLVRLGEARCKTPEEFKAWSQNLGHEDVLTTFYSYGTVPSHRQGEIMKKLSMQTTETQTEAENIAEAVARKLGILIP